LVTQYNRTVDELEQSARLLAKSERESAWKSMARQIAHEINNPLTPMKLSIQQLQRRKNMEDENFDEYFKNTTVMLVEQIDNLSRIAGTFSDFARMPEANLTQVDVSAILQSVVQLFANNKEQIEIRYTGETDITPVLADAKQLMQVFNNLIKNAIQAIPQHRKGVIEVSLKHREQSLLIAIADNGKGVSQDIWDKMFVPNFTTKAQGMGLGLAISKKMIEQLGGSISFQTEEGKGSTFFVDIPLKTN
jgi:nitrogen fixation/metabolism regulation signal transduction histidine kinase